MKQINFATRYIRAAVMISAILFGQLAFASSALASVGKLINIEPDDYAHQQVLNTISPHVTLSTGAFSDAPVEVASGSAASFWPLSQISW